MRDFGNGGKVLHLERQRSGGLGEHKLRVRAKIALDGRTGERIVIADLDAQTRQVMAAKASCRAIHDIGDEDMVTRVQQGEKRKGRRGEPRCNRECAMAAFDLCNRILQVRDCRQAVQAVGNQVIFAAGRLLERGDCRKEHRRRAEDGRVDGAEEALGMTPETARQSRRPPFTIFGHRFSNSAGRLSRMRATSSAIVALASTTMASAGSSSVANWLASSVAGM